MGFRLLAKAQPQEGFEKSLSAFFGVVNELKEVEVKRKTFLGDPAVRPQPGAQRGPEALDGVHVNHLTMYRWPWVKQIAKWRRLRTSQPPIKDIDAKTI
mgnify:CR=1 FL=1